jgi:altronate hydrolase
MEKGLILVHDGDYAAVALADLKAGETYEVAGQTVTLAEYIPFGHKVALREIAKGENVIKYGNPLGHATCDIHVGQHIHTHNMATNLDGHISYTYQPDRAALAAFSGAVENATFDGYPRPDGRAGVRNELWIVPTVGCVNMTAQRLAERAKAEFGDRFDDIRAYTHNMGCSQLGDDQANTMKLLAGLIHNPNAGGVLVLSLGCENNNLDVFRPYLGDVDESRIKFLVTQETEDEYEAGMELLRTLNETVGGMKRQPVPASKLVIGFKCGGSDAFSGVTANPLCGRLCDRVVKAGGSCVLTEVPEMFGAEHLLMARAVDKDTFDQTVTLINDYKDYFTRHGQVIYENPSPGN